jgi:hypothetical protein
MDATIPEPLSQIVMKLLAKTAEERYQSALGLRADLEHCAEAEIVDVESRCRGHGICHDHRVVAAGAHRASPYSR